MLSDRFKQALVGCRLRGFTMQRLALDAGLTPAALSQTLHGFRWFEGDKPKLVKIGRRLGLRAAECFVDDASDAPAIANTDSYTSGR